MTQLQIKLTNLFGCQDRSRSVSSQDRSRSVLETYRPLALARLYGESRIFTVNFVWYGLGRNDEGDSLAEKYLSANLWGESIFWRIFGRKYLSLMRISLESLDLDP